jgi:hypothetical protein
MPEGVLLKTVKPSRWQLQLIRMIHQDSPNKMKKLIPISCALWLGLLQIACSDFHPSYDPKDWPEHIIKFPAEGTLKDIFDAGIRPYRFPSLEKSSLGFKHVKIIMELKTGERLPPIDVEWGDISPLKGGLLDNMQVTSPNLSVFEAESAMMPFLKKGNRTAEQLKSFLAAATADPRNYDDPYKGDPSKFAISWNDIQGPKYSVFFKSTFDSSKPVSIAMIVSWLSPPRTPLQRNSFYDVPIPPPPGYENVSMDAPKNFGPDSAVEVARSKGLPITGDRTPEEYEKQWREANTNTRDPKPKTPAVEPKPKSAESPEIWPWLVGIIGFIITAILIWRWKVKSAIPGNGNFTP